jgi:hypothetical protein
MSGDEPPSLQHIGPVTTFLGDIRFALDQIDNGAPELWLAVGADGHER